MIRPDNLTEDDDAIYLIVNPPAPNVEFALQNGVSVLSVDGNHCNEAIVKLRIVNHPIFDCFRNPLLVYLTIRSDGRAMSYMQIMSNRRLLNVNYSRMLHFY